MSSLAHDESPHQTKKGTESRRGLSRDIVENAKTATKIAIDVLVVVAEVTENVPYLGAISKALSAFNEVLDEVSICKEDCGAATSEVREFVDLIQEFEAKAIPSNNREKENDMQKAFAELGGAMLKCLNTLQALRVDSTRKRDRLKLMFKRGDVQSSVTECRDRMRVAKEKFNMRMTFDTNNMVRDLYHRLPEDLSRMNVSRARSGWRLRAANSIFHGRESEVESAVDLIMNKAPARVAILGPGGIGKTSIALAVLHDPQIEELYGKRRCFMSCEATATADAIVRALARALGLAVTDGIPSDAIQHDLLDELRHAPGIICLDNLETPLDADKLAVEELLNEIAALPSVAMLITSRDSSIPAIKWTLPTLPHIIPFSQEAAISTWDDICGGHDDYAIMLLEIVDRDSKSIWARWQAEHVGLIHTGQKDHRLFDIGASIELSLRALDNPQETVAVLGIICIVADELYVDHISALNKAMKDRLSFSKAITELKRFSLIYTEGHEEPITRVLSPIRYYIQENHISDELCLMVAKALSTLTGRGLMFYAFITFGVNRSGVCRECCLELVCSDPFMTNNVEVLDRALEKARALDPEIQSRILQRRGFLLSTKGDYQNSRLMLNAALEIDERLGNRVDLFHDWVTWVETFALEFEGREDDCEHLDEVQEAIQKAWKLGLNERHAWDQSLYRYSNLAEAQHFVNEGRRKLHMPVVHRSGLYWDDASTDGLHPHWCIPETFECYNRLLDVASPPWDLSLILETHRTLGHANLEGQGRHRRG